MQTNNNPMWIALTVLGGIVAYSMLRKDTIAVADKVGDGVVYVADKANPLSQKNIVNSVITATGEAITGGGSGSWSLGTQIYDWTHPDNKTNTPPKKPLSQSQTTTATQSTNPRAPNYRASTPKPTAPKKTEAGLPARQSKGTWLKLQGGKWIPLTKSDKVFTVRGANVVHHHTWKPS